jgi:hypothetical protein
MKKIILALLILGSLIAYGFQDKIISSSTGQNSVVTDSNVTSVSEVIRLTDEGHAAVITTLSGGAGYVINTYQGLVGGAWVTLATDSVGVQTKTYNLRVSGTITIPTQQVRISRAITRSSGTLTLRQQLTAY